MIDIPKLSVVVPILNEEGSLRDLHSRLTTELTATGHTYEILFVNDGSTDGSSVLVEELANRDPHIGVIHFRRNFGKAAALDAGFRMASGQIIFTMDADLQDEPKEIPRFLEKLNEGFDVISGWKMIRHDPLEKTLPSKLFNFLVRRVSGLRLNDFNCGFKAYRAEAIKKLKLYGELHRYIPVILFWQGFSIGEISVTHHPRTSGVSKYGAQRYAKGFFDLMTVLLTTRFRSRPLHLFGFGGLIVSATGGIMLLYLFLMSVLNLSKMRPRPLLYLAIVLVMVGVQLISTGLLAELITSRGEAVQEDHYVIRSYRSPQAVVSVQNTQISNPEQTDDSTGR